MSFAIGQRVLVFKDENWWPARVVSAELEGLTAPEAGSSVVKYYGYDTCEEVSNTNVEIFDHNPRLATIDGDFAVLVQLAQEDSFALQSVAAPAKKKAASAAVKEVRAEPPPKRNRSEKNAPPRRPETQETEPTHTEKPPATTDDLFYWKSLLESAVQNADLPQARKALVWLVRHRVTYEQLLETKVGVAVTSVCRESALTGISGLARIIIRTWAHLLPAQTQTVVRNHAARRHEPSRVRENASRPEKGLSQRLHDFLSDCDPDLLVNVPQVAAQLEAAALSQADRVKLLTVLGNPKHTELKKKLLTLELTADMFFHLQGDDLLTPAERAKKQKDLEAELAAREEASKFATSDMYECPKCQARKSTYYQQQTRGGDEPMTVFVTCRACNFQWTQE